MSNEFDSAVSVINESIKTMHHMGGSYPKEFIQQTTEKLYLDNNKNFTETLFILNHIANTRYRNTAQKHLEYISKYGLRHHYIPSKVDKPINHISEFFFAYFLCLIMIWPAIIAPISLLSLISNSENEDLVAGQVLGSVAALVTLIYLLSILL